MQSPQPSSVDPLVPEVPRRNFLAEALAVLFGSIAGIIPTLAGVLFFFDPLLRKRAQGSGDGFVRITTLDALPQDGTPSKFPVIADRTDAWNYFPNEAVGAVFLRKTSEGKVTAFNVICPHLGCSIDYESSARHFHCPCHDSTFDVDGNRQKTTPPRGMDTLEVDPDRLRKGEVWVKFQNFRTGHEEKIPKT